MDQLQAQSSQNAATQDPQAIGQSNLLPAASGVQGGNPNTLLSNPSNTQSLVVAPACTVNCVASKSLPPATPKSSYGTPLILLIGLFVITGAITVFWKPSYMRN